LPDFSRLSIACACLLPFHCCTSALWQCVHASTPAYTFCASTGLGHLNWTFFRPSLYSLIILSIGLAFSYSGPSCCEKPLGDAIAPFSSVAEALGWMYVVERATAIHHRVREHVLDLMPHLEPATTYLSAYETSIGSRWLELGEAIELIACDERSHAQVTAAACEAFRCSIAWMQRGRARPARQVG